MPSLKKYFIDLDLNMKHTLNSYLRSIGKDPTNIWKQMEDSIKTVYYTKEKQMLRITANHKSTRFSTLDLSQNLKLKNIFINFLKEFLRNGSF
jgi:hypothetical protein